MSRKYKRLSIIFLVLAIVFMTAACVKTKTDLVSGENSTNRSVNIQKKNIVVPYESIKFQAKVKPYKVNSDLSNIENLDQFGEFSEEQKDLLINNNFFVNPTKEEQLFYIYEDNEYKNIPSFITTDSVLQVYHIFYDYTLRNLEEQKLLEILEELTYNMLKDSISIYNQITDEEIKNIQLKNIAFFSVAQLSLEKELTDDVPKKAKDMAQKEYEKINNHLGFENSSIFPYELDYSQFIPRGHYTWTKDFERYFKAMMWYGQAPFPLYMDEEKGERNIEQTLQALLITYSLCSDKEGYNLWEQIYEPTNFFVGSSDDLGIYEYGDLLFKIYGDNPDLNKLNDSKKLDELYKEAKKLPEPKIKAKYTTVNTPIGKQFRFMGQRYVLDAEIIQELVEPIIRPIPSGLDVLGVLGSERAREIQMKKEENQDWDNYPRKFDRLRDRFGKLEDSKWRTNMYQGWLWTLKGLLKPYGKGYPSFMTNEAWIDKNLTTALASWAELKHDTILYGKQSGAEMGGGYGEPAGYVEPNMEIYEKLLWLTKFSKENLKERDLLLENIEDKIKEFEDLLEFLIHASVKQLNNEELTEEEYYKIVYYGGALEHLSCSFVEGNLGYWHEITSDTDRNMALTADFHTIAPNAYSDGGYLEAAVGTANEIYVVVPIANKLYLTRGAVFGYHEFISNERLTDERWQEMLKKEIAPNMPEWTKSFIRGGKGEIPYPEE